MRRVSPRLIAEFGGTKSRNAPFKLSNIPYSSRFSCHVCAGDARFVDTTKSLFYCSKECVEMKINK